MGMSDLYYKLEEKYYSSLDWFDSKGLHFFYKIDEWLQAKNLPSFAIVSGFSFLILIGIILLILFASGVFGIPTVDVTFKFVDISNNALVPNLGVNLSYLDYSEVLTTNSNGELEVSLPKEEYVYLNVSGNYSLEQSNYFFSDEEYVVVDLINKSALLTKTLHLYEDFDSKALFSDIVELDLVCSDNSDYVKKKTITDGILELNDLPSDCGQLIVSSNYPELSASISTNLDSLDILVNSPETKTGVLRVITQDEEGNALANINISAYNDGISYGGNLTTETGLVEFELPINQYYIIASDSLGDYSYISTEGSTEEGCFNTLSENEPTVCTLTLTKANVGKINLSISDISGKPVNNATIKIYKEDVLIFTEELKEDAKGQFKKGVPNMGPYRVVVDSLAYMIYDNAKIFASEVPLEVHLEPVKSAPVLSVYVTANSELVANATVQLFKEGNLILTKNTGADGIAFFDRLEVGKTYSAKVTKGEYSSTSKPIVLDLRQENKLEVPMIIGKGNLDVLVYNLNNAPLENMTVQLYSAFTDKVVGQSVISDALGVAHFYGVSADKTVYAKVSSSKGTSYSLPLEISANNTLTLETYFSEESSNFSLGLIGLYNKDGTQINTLPYSVVPSGEYYALFLLNVPKGTPYTSGSVFFIGDAKESSSSNILIESSETLFGLETKGLTYTSNFGLAEDMLNKTNDNALWSQLNVSKINAGSSLVKVNFFVNNDARKSLSLGYRASLKSGSSVLRDPIDPALGQNESSSEKLGFYSEYNKMFFTTGDLVCSDIACISLSAQDDLGNITELYNDDYYSAYNSATVMSLNIIPATKKTYKNLKLMISTQNLGIDISNVSGKINSSNLKFEKKANEYVANIDNFIPSTGINTTLGFKASKAGETLLNISLVSDNGDVLFSKELKIIVDSAKDLTVEYLPSLIVPYVLNLGAVVVNDATENFSVEGAVVNVYLNDVLLKNGKTDFEGKMPLELQKPNAGDELRIQVNAPGYNEVSTSMKITENILIPDKPEVNVIVDRAESEKVSTNVLLKNNLPYTLKIKKVGFSTNAFSEFITLKTNVNANKTFDGNLDLNISAELTDLGNSLLEPKEFSTNLELLVYAQEIDKTWNVQIPLTIYIRMYDSLDALDCLALNLTSVSGMEYNFKLENSCLYSAENVNLYNATAFVEWDGSLLGTFLYNNESIDDNGLLVLKEVSKSNNFKLVFIKDPNVASGDAKANIVLKAYFPTNTGLQEIIAKKELPVIVSDYTKCLQVISPDGKILTTESALTSPIVLGVTSFGLGYNMLGSMYGGMLDPMLSSSNAYSLGYGNMLGGTTYLQTPNYSSNYDALMNSHSQSDPRLLYSGIAPTNTIGTTGSLGTTSSYNNVNNLMLQQQMQQQALNSRYSSNTYDTTNNINNNRIMQAESLGEKILFDYYPNSSMLQYGAQSPYAMQQFGAMLPNMLLPSVNKVQFRNNCNTEVEVDVRAMPQIYVAPNTFKLAPKQTNEVQIMSSTLPGTYTMNVLAGVENNLAPILSIPINVIDYASHTAGPECFKLDGEPVINMSDVFKRNKLVKVYNYCYSKGVIFDEAQPVALHNLVSRKVVDSQLTNKKECLTEIKNYNSENRNKKNFKERSTTECDGLTIEENTPYVIATSIGVPQVEYSGTYGQYQVITVMLEKDPTIQRIITEKLSQRTGWSDTVSTLSKTRSYLADLYNNVEFPALFVINARIGYGPTGLKKSVEKIVTVRDMWNVLGAADILENLAGENANCSPDKWNNNNIVSNINAELKDEYFNGDDARVPFKGAYDLLNKNCFGAYDGVTFEPIDYSVKVGDLTLKLVPKYSDNQIYFEVTGNGCFEGTGDASVKIGYVINSHFYSDVSFEKAKKELSLNLKVIFKKKLCFSGDVSTTNNLVTAGTSTGATNPGTTGTTNLTSNWCATNFGADWKPLEQYGFGALTNLNKGNMLNFDYAKPNPVDCSKNFCDAEQLKQFLSGKFKTVSNNLLVASQKYNNINFVISSNNNLIEIAPNKLLDELSSYFFNKTIATYITNTNAGQNEFKELVENMPNLYFIKELPNTTPDADFNIGNKFYFNAKALSLNPNANDLITKYFLDDFNTKFLVPLSTTDLYNYYAVLDDSYKDFGSAFKVYLKPDDYNAVLTNNSFLSYGVNNVKGNVTEAKPYLVFVNELNKNKQVVIIPVDYYFSKEAKDIIANSKLYNLAMDATNNSDRFGLCVHDGQLTNLLANASNTTVNCDNAVFNKAKVLEVNGITDLEFKYSERISASLFGDYEVSVPQCNKNTGCVVNIANNKTVTAPVESYSLDTIFNNANNYCYKETNEILNIKYSGNR